MGTHIRQQFYKRPPREKRSQRHLADRCCKQTVKTPAKRNSSPCHYHYSSHQLSHVAGRKLFYLQWSQTSGRERLERTGRRNQHISGPMVRKAITKNEKDDNVWNLHTGNITQRMQ